MTPLARRLGYGGPAALAALALLLLGATPAWATRLPLPAGHDAALTLLDRAVGAGRTLTYGGVQSLAVWTSQGSASEVIDVTHTAGQGVTLDIRPTSAAPAAGVLDSNESSLTVVDEETLGILTDDYSLALAPAQSVAGRRCAVVEARRPGGALAARFFVDQATGLLLEREVFDPAGRLLRYSAFTSVAVGRLPGGAAPRRGAVLTSVPSPWADDVPLTRAGALRRAGWQVPLTLAGGRSGRMMLADIRLSGGHRTTLHLLYTDGLSTMSVFEEHGRLPASGLHGWRAARLAGRRVWVAGALPEQVAWSGRRMVFTVVSDAAPQQLDAAVRALPHAARPGLLRRLEQGLARLGHWLNPF